jgi:hypothetical protein
MKPPKGSNVAGEDLFEVLIQEGEMKYDSTSQWKYLCKGIVCNTVVGSSAQGTRNHDEEEEILAATAGYVAKKAIAFNRCSACKDTLISTDSSNISKLIDYKNYFGVLHYPSDTLLAVIQILEEVIMNEVGKTPQLTPDTFFAIAYKMQEVLLPQVGCSLHYEEVVGYVVQFYLVLRMHIVAKFVNNRIVNFQKPAELKKMGKLVQGSTVENNSSASLPSTSVIDDEDELIF